MTRRIRNTLLALGSLALGFGLVPVIRHAAASFAAPPHVLGGGGFLTGANQVPFTASGALSGTLTTYYTLTNVPCFPPGNINFLIHWSVSSADTVTNNANVGFTFNNNTFIGNGQVLPAYKQSLTGVTNYADVTTITPVTCTPGTTSTVYFLADLAGAPGASPPQLTIEGLALP